MEKYYEDLLDLFQTDGWKAFIQDYQESMAALIENSSTDCDTNDKWQFRRGELSQLHNVVNFERYIRTVVQNNDSV